MEGMPNWAGDRMKRLQQEWRLQRHDEPSELGHEGKVAVGVKLPETTRITMKCLKFLCW